MNKFELCKIAHEFKDKFEEAMVEHEGVKQMNPTAQLADIPMTMKVDYLIARALCEDKMHEVTREEVYEPVNAKMREADGLTQPKFMQSMDHSKLIATDTAKNLKGKDLHKAANAMLKYIDSIKNVDPHKYNAMMHELAEM